MAPHKRHLERLPIERLQQTRPPDWIARESLEGRFIFERKESDSEDTSWWHLEPNFDPALYARQSQDLFPLRSGFQISLIQCENPGKNTSTISCLNYLAVHEADMC